MSDAGFKASKDVLYGVRLLKKKSPERGACNPNGEDNVLSERSLHLLSDRNAQGQIKKAGDWLCAQYRDVRSEPVIATLSTSASAFHLMLSSTGHEVSWLGGATGQESKRNSVLHLALRPRGGVDLLVSEVGSICGFPVYFDPTTSDDSAQLLASLGSFLLHDHPSNIAFADLLAVLDPQQASLAFAVICPVEAIGDWIKSVRSECHRKGLGTVYGAFAVTHDDDWSLDNAEACWSSVSAVLQHHERLKIAHRNVPRGDALLPPGSATVWLAIHA